jgi:hypothetical protein
MRTKSIGVSLVAAAGVALLASAGACASTPDPARYALIGLPDRGQFSDNTMGVHIFLERQCGTLDCHGQVGRPFRLFSQFGLRAAMDDGGNVPGGTPDTDAEIYANYLSLIGLEPEEMSRVVAGQDPPTFLLVVKKPRGLESHKGGVRFHEGDDADVCLTGWLGGQFVAQACANATMLP